MRVLVHATGAPFPLFRRMLLLWNFCTFRSEIDAQVSLCRTKRKEMMGGPFAARFERN